MRLFLQPGVLVPLHFCGFCSDEPLRDGRVGTGVVYVLFVESCVYRWMEFLAWKREWDDEKNERTVKKKGSPVSL